MRAFVTGGSGFVGRTLIRRLVERGDVVRGLARSDGSAQVVRAAGGEVVQGDLSDEAAMAKGMRGYDVVFHVAARFDLWGPYKPFYQDNVVGTERVLAAATAAGVRRLVQVGAAAVVIGKDTIVHNADESLPLQRPRFSPYIATKSIAEERVRSANSATLTTSVVRPSYIWGPGDKNLSNAALAVRKGQFGWIDGGNYPFVTTHVENVCHGLILAAERGRGGAAYFLTDGDVISFRDLFIGMLATQGVEPPTRTFSYRMAWRVAGMMEWGWWLMRRRNPPPLTKAMVRLIGQEMTLNDKKARDELGYSPVMSRAEGLAGLSAQSSN